MYLLLSCGTKSKLMGTKVKKNKHNIFMLFNINIHDKVKMNIYTFAAQKKINIGQ
jgi:hypothetical protein